MSASAQGAGNVVTAGGGVINTNGSNLGSPDGLPAVSASGAGIVSAGGGNIAPHDNIVAQGGGNQSITRLNALSIVRREHRSTRS